MSTFITLVQNSTESSNQCNKARKKKSKTYNLERKVKLPLFANDMMVYIENPKQSTHKKKLVLIKEFRKFPSWLSGNKPN